MARRAKSSEPVDPIPYALFDTAVGTCAVAWGADGLRRVDLPEASPAATTRRLHAALGGVVAEQPPAEVRRAMRAITRHLEGKSAALDRIPLDMAGLSPFSQKVYRALRRVGRGHTVSYGELARSIGTPGAARAVGRAMASNPFPIVVPCHRVLAGGGKAGGFSAHGGLSTKARLLAIEGVELDR
jgi:methylated-DNA-[protein]-cysteine S-methyltransferase